VDPVFIYDSILNSRTVAIGLKDKIYFCYLQAIVKVIAITAIIQFLNVKSND